jgi:hypothetical protein
MGWQRVDINANEKGEKSAKVKYFLLVYAFLIPSGILKSKNRE